MKANEFIAEKSKSKKQSKTMTAACKNAEFRKKVDIPKEISEKQKQLLDEWNK